MDKKQKSTIISISMAAGCFFGVWNSSIAAGIFMFWALIAFTIIMDYTYNGGGE